MIINNTVLSFLFTLFSYQVLAANLTVTVENINNTSGAIHIALFTDSADFPNPSSKVGGIVLKTEQPSVTGRFSDLPEKDYAIAVFHDVNGNNKLDKNFFGIPKEPYGFSGNAAGIGVPNFNEATSYIKEEDLNIVIKLRH